MSTAVVSNWSNLPGDLWVSIGLRVDAAADRVRFRAVSKSLRSNLPYKQPPWLMLSEYHESDSEDEEGLAPPRRRFVIVGEQNYYKMDLPQAHLARCVGSTNNWVITVKSDSIIRLLNPFSKLEIELPSQLTFEHQILPDVLEKTLSEKEQDTYRDTFLRKLIIYSPSSCSGGNDFLVIAIQIHGKVAMARLGDSCWTSINIDYKATGGVRDIIMYQGRLYAINFFGRLLSSDILSHSAPPKLSVLVEKFDKFELKPYFSNSLTQILYLVEWCGYLLLVIKFIHIFGKNQMGRTVTVPFYKTNRFQIFRFDFTNTDWIEIESLGEYSLFLGVNTSVSILASDYLGLVKKNCIYFTDDHHSGYYGSRTPGGYDMGVFDLDDNTITPHYKGKSICRCSPSIWIVPD